MLPLRLDYSRSVGTHLSASLADPEAAQLRAGVQAHNAFAAETIVEGCTPPRFRRVFHGAWELHGRWYAAGEGSYQMMPEAERLRLLRIGGEPVAEIDAKAAHLTILLALANQALSAHEDPYDVPGIPRAVVKSWVTATLGKGSPVRRWSSGAPRACLAFDAEAVGAALIALHPAMRDPAASVPDALAERLGGRRSILPHYLMALEATAVTGAMERLRDAHRVLALPVHDALIVPCSAAEIAEVVLREEFGRVIGVAPGLEVQRAG
ncbi:hypothetical protein JMJ55_30325 [Belnapia sp. T6]|uniref:Uncharacterized protein n=1 Tax=Belnapia mucosa TaxID=2804532 RepID=A0ABS1VD19_9PROT|nr:hypothetical protein [Belnapia mucosa]MBL6459600.1 hypothetical protein [Belnapia mucosa]